MSEPSLKGRRRPRRKTSLPAEKQPPENTAAEHPIADLSGLFKDDPLWEEFLQAIQHARAEENAKEDVSGRDEHD